VFINPNCISLMSTFWVRRKKRHIGGIVPVYGNAYHSVYRHPYINVYDEPEEDPIDPREPVDDHGTPEEDPTDPREPVDDHGKPAEDPTDQGEPGEDPGKPAEDPTDPGEPGEDPGEPIEDPTDPGEPGEDPGEPGNSDGDIQPTDIDPFGLFDGDNSNLTPDQVRDINNTFGPAGEHMSLDEIPPDIWEALHSIKDIDDILISMASSYDLSKRLLGLVNAYREGGLSEAFMARIGEMRNTIERVGSNLLRRIPIDSIGQRFQQLVQNNVYDEPLVLTGPDQVELGILNQNGRIELNVDNLLDDNVGDVIRDIEARGFDVEIPPEQFPGILGGPGMDQEAIDAMSELELEVRNIIAAEGGDFWENLDAAGELTAEDELLLNAMIADEEAAADVIVGGLASVAEGVAGLGLAAFVQLTGLGTYINTAMNTLLDGNYLDGPVSALLANAKNRLKDLLVPDSMGTELRTKILDGMDPVTRDLFNSMDNASRDKFWLFDTTNDDRVEMLRRQLQVRASNFNAYKNRAYDDIKSLGTGPARDWATVARTDNLLLELQTRRLNGQIDLDTFNMVSRLKVDALDSWLYTESDEYRNRLLRDPTLYLDPPGGMRDGVMGDEVVHGQTVDRRAVALSLAYGHAINNKIVSHALVNRIKGTHEVPLDTVADTGKNFNLQGVPIESGFEESKRTLAGLLDNI
jgi:hypothetical protein